MSPMNSQMQQRPQCPACGGDPQRGRKKMEPACNVCKGGMSDSPAGKQAMTVAARQGAMKVKQQMAQRQQMQARQQMAQRGMAQGMRPGMGAPMGRPLVDPRVAAAIMNRLRGGQ